MLLLGWRRLTLLPSVCGRVRVFPILPHLPASNSVLHKEQKKLPLVALSRRRRPPTFICGGELPISTPFQRSPAPTADPALGESPPPPLLSACSPFAAPPPPGGDCTRIAVDNDAELCKVLGVETSSSVAVTCR
jgi:hypothetical protein